MASPKGSTLSVNYGGDKTDGEVRMVKIVFFGASRTGKTALIKRFLDGKFDEKYIETVDEIYQKTFCTRGKLFDVRFHDMAGSNEFPAMRRVLVSGADGFVIVCSPYVENSFDNIDSAWSEIAAAKKSTEMLSKTPFVIVLSKQDLSLEDAVQQEAKQELSMKIHDWLNNNRDQIDDYERRKPLLYAETSAKTDSGIKTPFEKLLEQVYPNSEENMPAGNGEGGNFSAIGALAGKMTIKGTISNPSNPLPTPTRGFSVYRKKENSECDKDKNKEDGSKLHRAKATSKSFIFRGRDKSAKKDKDDKVEECSLQ